MKTKKTKGDERMEEEVKESVIVPEAEHPFLVERNRIMVEKAKKEQENR
jgi:hypothetical protein